MALTSIVLERERKRKGWKATKQLFSVTLYIFYTTGNKTEFIRHVGFDTFKLILLNVHLKKIYMYNT